MFFMLEPLKEEEFSSICFIHVSPVRCANVFTTCWDMLGPTSIEMEHAGVRDIIDCHRPRMLVGPLYVPRVW